MSYDPERHHRRSIRLKGYDYTRPGAYFVTISTYQRECLFGKLVDGEMRLNAYGEIVRDEWFKTAQIRPNVLLTADEFVVMPNHIHGIIWIVDDLETRPVGATRRVAPTATQRPRGPEPGSIAAIVGSFKSAVAKRINRMRQTRGAAVWQRNYYEHIIRNERALRAIRRYILENPLRWHLDRYNTGREGLDSLSARIWGMMQHAEPPPAQPRAQGEGERRGENR